VRGYFAPLASAKRVLLSMLTRPGPPVSAPVRVVVDGDRAYFLTWKPSRIRKHLRHAGWVQVAPCGMLGLCRYGPWLDAAPRLLDGEEAGEAARKLARKHPARPGRLGSLGYRLRGRQPVYYELQARAAAGSPEADDGVELARAAVDAQDCDQVVLDRVHDPVRADAQRQHLAPPERLWRVRAGG